MIKKLMTFAAVFAAAMCMAEVLVYDYTASFKRIDTARKLTNYNNVKFYLDTATTKSDKFKGYFVMEACKECTASGAGIEHTADLGDATPGSWSLVYIQRTGAKQRKGGVYRAVAKAYVTRFGNGGFSTPLMEYVRMDRLSNAAFELQFGIKENGNPGVEKDGFMGRGAVMAGWNIMNAGFGKTKALSYMTTGTYCVPGSPETCDVLNNASGNMLGEFAYSGCCSHYLFDLCGKDAGIYAPINGTFSVKLNNTMTFKNKEFVYSTFAAAEDAILKKMKATGLYHDAAETVAFQTYTGETLAAAVEW